MVKRIDGTGNEVKIGFMNMVVKNHLLANAEKLLGFSKEASHLRQIIGFKYRKTGGKTNLSGGAPQI